MTKNGEFSKNLEPNKRALLINHSAHRGSGPFTEDNSKLAFECNPHQKTPHIPFVTIYPSKTRRATRLIKSECRIFFAAAVQSRAPWLVETGANCFAVRKRRDAGLFEKGELGRRKVSGIHASMRVCRRCRISTRDEQWGILGGKLLCAALQNWEVYFTTGGMQTREICASVLELVWYLACKLKFAREGMQGITARVFVLAL